jgi:hypothetical protein
MSICEWCKKEFIDDIHQGPQRKYCSKECQRKSAARKPHLDGRFSVYRKTWREKILWEIFGRLGNKCFECGFSDIRILQIDHVNGGGLKEIQKVNKAKGIGSSSRSARYLLYVRKKIREGSKDYQLLCPNCNWIKRIENKEETSLKVVIRYD